MAPAPIQSSMPGRKLSATSAIEGQRSPQATIVHASARTSSTAAATAFRLRRQPSNTTGACDAASTQAAPLREVKTSCSPAATPAMAEGERGATSDDACVELLKLLMRVLWPTHYSVANHAIVLLAVGAAVGSITKVLGSPGDVELLVNNIHVLGGAEDVDDLKLLIPVSLLCIASGGGMGPEAPLVQTTGSLASWLALRWKVPTADVRVLTITGMAAGFTVLFGAPLGSAIFALEILHRRGLEYYEALLPAALGSLSGYAVYTVLTGVGLQPVWRFPHAANLRAVDIAWAVACGVAGALVSTVFTYVNVGLRRVFRRIPVAVRPLIGGLGLGLLAFWSPYALTFGETQINPLAVRHAAVAVFAVAAAAKLCGTSLTLASGWRGGFII